MKTDTNVHKIELKDARDDIIRHKPVQIRMWNRPDGVAYLSIDWEFIHMNITMFTCDRPTTEVEQMLRDAKAWSMTVQKISANKGTSWSTGEEYKTDEEE